MNVHYQRQVNERIREQKRSGECPLNKTTRRKTGKTEKTLILKKQFRPKPKKPGRFLYRSTGEGSTAAGGGSGGIRCGRRRWCEAAGPALKLEGGARDPRAATAMSAGTTGVDGDWAVPRSRSGRGRRSGSERGCGGASGRVRC